MCGICGFVSTADWSTDMLQKMNDVIFRRGPDGEGLLHSGVVGLAMRRLAIIDIAGGAQPVYNEDRSVAVVFNGEIYNFKALRAALQARGHQFRTSSDTEVIVHLYEERGAALVRELEGMFAFALWDAKNKTLLLARDRLGIKPLFIARLPGGVMFGSEIKSLLSTGLISDGLDWEALDAFLTYTFVPAPRTIYRDIFKVLPGTTVTVTPDGSLHTEPYWQLPDEARLQARSTTDWIARVDAELQRSVQSHLVSDVPVGAFLSGGVDSGLMVAMMATVTERPVETFTVSFEDAGAAFLDERIYARMIAQRYRLNHHEINVKPDVAGIIDDIVSAFDEPFADDSVIPSYYVSQAASGFVKVALTGLGGDELFGGYRRHLGVRVGDIYAHIPRWLREGMIDPLVRRIPEPKTSSDVVDHLKRFSRSSSASAADRYQDSMSSLPVLERARLYTSDVASRIDTARSSAIISDTFRSARGSSVDRALKTDLHYYLPDDILTLTDRLSMWHSLELRVPFLDHSLVETAMGIPSSLKIRGLRQKHILKEVAKKWLPAPVINHRKQGFEAPMGRWLQGPLRAMMQDTLSPEALAAGGILNVSEVERIKREHLTGIRKHSKTLFSLLMFQMWFNRDRTTGTHRSDKVRDVSRALASQPL
jgi:asparagine synthase (glutamine-hydrolysing)